MLVRMQIPIIPESKALLFWGWLPVTEEDFLVVRGDGISLKFWFDLTCIQGPFRPKEESELSHPNWIWVWTDKIFADVTLEGVSDELAEFVMTTDYYRDTTEPSTAGEQDRLDDYKRLGEKVYSFTLPNFNRLIAYVRSEKGQHWLEEYPVDPSTMGAVFKRFGSKVKVDDREWVSWVPTDVSSLTLTLPAPTQHMDREDWLRAGRFVNSPEQRPSLVKELLAGAWSLAEKQNRRSALTEAVTALEVAVATFARSPRADKAFGHKLAERLNLPQLHRQVDRVGLSGTIRYLFPVIFAEEQMPTELLNGCQEAITQRNNVVHQGQRDVRQERLDTFLASISRVCLLLADFSEATGGEVQG